MDKEFGLKCKGRIGSRLAPGYDRLTAEPALRAARGPATGDNVVKRFLFTTLISNDLGLLTRSLPIARELRELGHQVAFCSPGKAPARLIAQAGFENLIPRWPMLSILTGDTSLPVLLRLLLSRNGIREYGLLKSFVRHVREHTSAEIWNVDQFTHLLLMWNQDAARRLTDCLKGVVEQYAPDAVVDFLNPAACMAARACGRPLISVIQADQHPASGGFIWWREPPAGLPSALPFINQVLADNRLAPVSQTGELFVGDLTLCVGMPETDPLPEAAGVTYLGAVLWQKRAEELPAWVRDLSPDRPVIWLYVGNPRYSKRTRSPFDSGAVIAACCEALGDLDVQVVLTTGHHELPRELLPLPSNFRHGAYVPGLAMAARSDLLIHHGGYGSCQTGLYTGTPGLAIPTFSERESNARRVAAVGAGDFLLPVNEDRGKEKRVPADELRRKVEHLLSEPSYRENAGRISAKMKEYGGAEYAAGLIENFI